MRCVFLFLFLLLPASSWAEVDTLKAVSETAPTEWSNGGDSATAAIWSNDGVVISLNQGNGDAGTENHAFDMGNTSLTSIDSVRTIWESNVAFGTYSTKFNIVLGSDTTTGTDRTADGTYTEKMSNPHTSNDSWTPAQVDSLIIVIDGLSSYGFGEEQYVDYMWLEVFGSMSTASGQVIMIMGN